MASISERRYCSAWFEYWMGHSFNQRCDVTHNAQLSIFVWHLNGNFDVTENLFVLRQLTTTREEVIVGESAEINNIGWEKKYSVCTNEAPAVTRNVKGTTALLSNYLSWNIFQIRCITHQKNICAKDLDWSSVRKPVPVVRSINKIWRRDIFLFSGSYQWMWWVSKSALDKFWTLGEDVLRFIEDNSQWLASKSLLLKKESYISSKQLTKVHK